MKSIIFKSEKNAKVYQEIASETAGVYNAGDLIRTVKTDKVENLGNGQYKTFFKEIK